MKRTVKVHHSGAGRFPRFESICYKDFLESTNRIPIISSLLTPTSFLSIEFLSTISSIFVDDYFNMIDIYSVYKEGVLFFNPYQPPPWESDMEVAWGEYRAKLIEYLNIFLLNTLRSPIEMGIYCMFCMKWNLFPEVSVLRRGGVSRVLIEELKLSRLLKKSVCENFSIGQDWTKVFLLNEDTKSFRSLEEESTPEIKYVTKKILRMFSLYGKNSELKVRFILEILDSLSILIIRKVIINVKNAKRYQVVHLYYRLFEKFSKEGKHRMAFLHAIWTSGLLKQGINLPFEESMKLEALRCIKENGWSIVLEEAMSKMKIRDAEKFGVNPHMLRVETKYKFDFVSANPVPTDINKCTDTVLFNKNDNRVYFTDCIRLNIMFRQISSAYLRGVSTIIVHTGEKIFIPIHKTLDKSIETVDVYFEAECSKQQILDGVDEADVMLDRLIFSGSSPIQIGTKMTWIRRKSTLTIKSIEQLNSTNGDPTNVLFVFGIHRSGSFVPRIIGECVVEQDEGTASVFFNGVKNPGYTYTVHHEISPGVFQAVKLLYP